jgi:hypothetical protein
LCARYCSFFHIFHVRQLKQHIAVHVPQAVGMLDEEEYSRFFTRRAFTGQVIEK